ncbi:BapA prefix-like domain-containing protein [Loktanella sp. IMCC34160]|uniref:Ig-like domain-containing protein n=1 Tax=Loktanella sp. IMCC34160 TaxID=2510646 RepID=UPI00101D88EB|nr:Ig-like domain-containing protein [Loktanella sp. IMCC34160]RYG91788.1 BapA prefix-like domain-containing protein [Loktanella sp. IMCC34160]
MSAIEFVVRDSAGTVRHGSVASETGGMQSIIVSADQEISLNLHRSQVVSYRREGQALELTLIDGRVIVIEGFFTPDGIAENRLFLSADGLLAEVELSAGEGGSYYAAYSDADAVGKWSADDALYFMRSPDVMLANYEAIAVADGEAGMLAAPLLTGIGGIGGALGAGAAVIGGGILIDQVFDGGGGSSGPVVTIEEGTQGTGTVVNGDDAADGIEISGTGTPGGTVTVTIDGDTTQTTTVDENGEWTVVFDPEDVGDGEHDVTVTITDGNGSTTVTDTVLVDTVATVDFDGSTVTGDGIVNATENGGSVTLSGTVEAGSTVVVEINGNTYEATVTGTEWELILPAGTLPGGEYELDVTVIATDGAGNSAATVGTITVDTVTTIGMDTTTIGGDGSVNATELAGGVTVIGTAEPGATVDVTIGLVTLTTTAGVDGNWSVVFGSGDIAPGTYVADVTATATDLAGNTATSSGTIQIDTEMNLTVNTATVEGNGIVNAAEASDGISLSGTAEPGAQVTVTLNGYSQTVTASGNGTWTTTWPAGQLPTGETQSTVSVTAVDAAGNSETTSGTITFDTLVNQLNLTSGPVAGDNIVNGSEIGEAITLSGQVEAGSTVWVNLGGSTLQAAVDGNGNWSVTFPGGTLAAGEYNTNLVITAQDAAGNTSSISQAVQVDTVAGHLTMIDGDQVAGDGTINAQEAEGGVLLSGTATPGMIVTVTMAGATHQVLADGNGNWSSLFSDAEIPDGTTTAQISASITDAAGNTTTITDTVQIDTIVDDLAFVTNPAGGDGTISGRESSGSFVTLTGTVEPFSNVVVTLGGQTVTTTSDANGNWTANFPASVVPTGEGDLAMTVTATDPAGNVNTISDTVAYDTVVNALSSNGATITGNGSVNATEAGQGITLTGQVEPGSTVFVTFNGVTHQATVLADGSWSVDFSAAEVPAGEYTAEVTISATDAVGNTATITDTFLVDTVAPETPFITGIDDGRSGLRGISVADEDTSLQVHQLNADGSVTEVAFDPTVDSAYDEVDLAFAAPVPDGSQLVVTSTDAAGNQNATLFVLDEAGSNVVDLSHAGLDGINIGAIDLNFAEYSELTISAADLEALTSITNELVIHGDQYDTVNLQGATIVDTRTIDQVDYTVYEMGSAGELVVIQDEITVNNTII